MKMRECWDISRTFVVLALILMLVAPSPAYSGPDVLQTSVLVEFDDAAFKAAVTSAKHESAVASIASNAGASTNPRRPRIAAAAAGIPAAASLANSIVTKAKASRFRIRRYQSYGIVFDGMALEAETPAEADALRDWLRDNPKVKKIYPVYMVDLPEYIPPTQTKESLMQKSARSSVAAAAAAAVKPSQSRRSANRKRHISSAAAAAAVETSQRPAAAAAPVRQSEAVVHQHRKPRLESAMAKVPSNKTAAAAAAAASVRAAAAATDSDGTSSRSGRLTPAAAAAAAAAAAGKSGSAIRTSAAAAAAAEPPSTAAGSPDTAAAPAAKNTAAAAAQAAAQQAWEDILVAAQLEILSDDNKNNKIDPSADRSDSNADLQPKPPITQQQQQQQQVDKPQHGDKSDGNSSSGNGGSSKIAADTRSAVKKRVSTAVTASSIMPGSSGSGSSSGSRKNTVADGRPIPGDSSSSSSGRASRRNSVAAAGTFELPGNSSSSSSSSDDASRSGGNSSGSSSSQPASQATAKDAQQKRAKALNGGSSSSSGDDVSADKQRRQQHNQQQQQQQWSEEEEITEIVTKPVAAAPAAARALPPARSYVVPKDDYDDSGSSSSSSSGGGGSSDIPAAAAPPSPPSSSSSSDPELPLIPPAANATSDDDSSSSSSRPPARPRKDTDKPSNDKPPYLTDSDSIGGVDSTVKLPLGPDGDNVIFTPNLEWAAADLLTGVTELRTNFKLTGKGIRIGIIDTGIDYTHPAFGSCTAIAEPYGRCRVVAGKDLVGNDFVNGKDIAKPDNDPRDCHNSSHGTTVAGIAAAGWHPGAQMLGVAPEASIGAYKVFGCRGSAPTSAIIAAIQQAVLDGMDIINLSLSLGPGFPADPYESVMKRVYELGILATKSAGNQGTLSGQGLFWVDAYTGSGAITVGSADASTGTPGELVAADYSTYGPDGNLNLLPHVSSPGSNVLTTTFADSEDGYTVISGTSHATPYLSGGLALLLQLHRESSKRGAFKMANAWKSVMAFENMNQTSVMDALINTATPMTSDYDRLLPAPVSKSGAGLVNFASAYFNPIEVHPSYVALPSDMSTHAMIVTLRNNMSSLGPGRPEDQTYTYVVSHRGPAMAALISQEWGVMPLRLEDGIGPAVTIAPDIVTLGPGESVNITINFTSPAYAHQKPWLYSGYIDLRPMVKTKLEPDAPVVTTADIRDIPKGSQTSHNRSQKPRRVSSREIDAHDAAASEQDGSSSSSDGDGAEVVKTPTVTAVWSPNDRWDSIWRYDRDESPMPTPRPLVIPYQGVSRNYSTLPLIPGAASYLESLTPGLCYAPGDDNINVNYPEYAMDIAYDVNECEINTADYWTTEPIQIPIMDLRKRPCDLRITLSPQLPVRRIDLQLLNKRGQVLGTLPTINTPVFSRAPAYSAKSDGSKGSPKMLAVYSYCLSWQGKFTQIDPTTNETKPGTVVPGQTYSFVALLEAPTAKGDEALIPEPLRVRVPIRGKFTVVNRPSFTRKSRRLMQQQRQQQQQQQEGVSSVSSYLSRTVGRRIAGIQQIWSHQQ